MEQDSQITNNIDNLQAYCELLKQQGYNEEEIGQIIQQELSDQQEAFLSDKNENNETKYVDGKLQQTYQQRQEELDYYHEQIQMKNIEENQFDQHSSSENEFQHVRQYDQHNYLIKPHAEQDENEDSSPIFQSFSQQQNYSYNQKQNIKNEQEIYNQQNSKENKRIILGEKNITNIMNKMPSAQSKAHQFEQIQRNLTTKQQIQNEPISRGSISISNSQKDDSIQQFAPLRSSERQNSDSVNSQNNQIYKNQQRNEANLKNMKPSLQQWPSQQYFKQNKTVLKSDENHFNNSTANFIHNSYQNKIGEYQKIQNKSRIKTPTKVQKPIKSMSQEEKQLIELKNKLRTVFTFYVSFGDRINVNYLKSNKFHKMMSDAQLKDNIILTQNRLDLMFVKENHNKHNMDFDTFLTLIAKIAILKFPQFTDAQALQMILQNHFLPLYDNIMAETDLGEDEIKFKEPIDEGPLFILKEITPVIQLIYQHYFPFEWKNRGNEVQVKQKSETAIFQFLKEYDICPNLITKSSAFLLFREILDTQIDNLCMNPQLTNLSGFLSEDQGQCFTFWKYAIYLIRIANVCYSNLFNQLEQPAEGANRTVAEKLAFLLERMELSVGFLNLDKKNLSHQSLIIKKKVLNRMLSNGSIIGSCQMSSLNSQLAVNNNIGGQYSLNLQQPTNSSSNGTETLSNLQSNQENSSVQSQTSSRVTRSRSDLRLRQSANGLTEMQQQCVRNYSPMGFTNYSQKLNEQQRQVMIAHIQNMQNYKLFKNPLGLADIQSVENIQLIDQFSDRLLTIFQSYCSFGDALNTQWMKSSKYTKLMREANIININFISNQGSVMQNQNSLQACPEENNRYLTGCDIDLIFIKASKKRSAQNNSQTSQQDLNKQDTIKQQQRLDFEQFLVSLEMVAQKLYKEISLFEGMSQLLQNNILPVLESEVNANDNRKNNPSSIGKSVHSSTQNEHISILMEILKDQEIVELLGMIHKTMMVYFKYYSQNKNTIDFDKFVKFCKDFGIFPDIIPKSRLLKIFNTLAQIYNTTEMAQAQLQNSSNYNEKPMIDQHLFIEAIALCAFEVPYSDPQPTEIEKICYLVERMNQSGGQIFIQKQIGHTRSQSSSSVSWDIIQPIRKKYPHLFNCSNYSQFNNYNQLSCQNGLINNQISQIKQPYNTQNSMSKGNMFDDIMKRNLNIQNHN